MDVQGLPTRAQNGPDWLFAVPAGDSKQRWSQKGTRFPSKSCVTRSLKQDMFSWTRREIHLNAPVSSKHIANQSVATQQWQECAGIRFSSGGLDSRQTTMLNWFFGGPRSSEQSKSWVRGWHGPVQMWNHPRRESSKVVYHFPFACGPNTQRPVRCLGPMTKAPPPRAATKACQKPKLGFTK